MKFKASILHIAALTALSLACNAQAAVIVNGSFEDPVINPGSFEIYNEGSTVITGWTVVGLNTGLISGSYVEGLIQFQAQDGVQWVDLTGPGSLSSTGITQTLATDIGQAYELSFYVGSVSDGVAYFPSTVDLQINGGARVSYTNPAAPTTSLDWKLFTAGFTANSATTSITFLNGNTIYNNISALDNVSIAAVPEPSSSLLVIAGGVVGMSFSRRRSGKA